MQTWDLLWTNTQIHVQTSLAVPLPCPRCWQTKVCHGTDALSMPALLSLMLLYLLSPSRLELHRELCKPFETSLCCTTGVEYEDGTPATESQQAKVSLSHVWMSLAFASLMRTLTDGVMVSRQSSPGSVGATRQVLC
jgi:hypothetical protein